MLEPSEAQEPIQGFCIDRIEAVTAPATLDVSDVLAIRVSEAVTYSVVSGGDEAVLPAGSVTVIRATKSELFIATDCAIEIMKR